MRFIDDEYYLLLDMFAKTDRFTFARAAFEPRNLERNFLVGSHDSVHVCLVVIHEPLTLQCDECINFDINGEK